MHENLKPSNITVNLVYNMLSSKILYLSHFIVQGAPSCFKLNLRLRSRRESGNSRLAPLQAFLTALPTVCWTQWCIWAYDCAMRTVYFNKTFHLKSASTTSKNRQKPYNILLRDKVLNHPSRIIIVLLDWFGNMAEHQ